jgi:hypothetical protein
MESWASAAALSPAAAAAPAVFAAGAALTLSVSSSRKRLFKKGFGQTVPFTLKVGAEEPDSPRRKGRSGSVVVDGISPTSLGDGDAGAGPLLSSPRGSLLDEAADTSGTSGDSGTLDTPGLDASVAWAAARAELELKLEDTVSNLNSSFILERARWEDERQSLHSQLLRKDAELQRLGAVEVKLSDTIASKNFVSAELERVRRLAERLENESVSASCGAGIADELANVRHDLQAARYEAAREREMMQRQQRDDKARYNMLVDQFHDKEEQIKRLEKENDLLAAAAESSHPRLVKQEPVSPPEQHAQRAQYEQQLAALQAQLSDAVAETARAAAERDLACRARDELRRERDSLIERALPLDAAAAVLGAALAFFM